jgi:hypothetical protein
MGWAYRTSPLSQLTCIDLAQSFDELKPMVPKTTREATKKEGQELPKASMLTAVQNDS